MRRAAAFALLPLLLGFPVPARAHETLHEIRRGEAIGVRAFFADGEVLAYVPYEVYSPADPKIPHAKGRTDRGGWVAFVPDAAGRWRVRVIDDSGHGLDVEVEAAPSGKEGASGGSLPALTFALRPLIGLAIVGAVFALLVARRRRKERRP